MAYTPFGAPAQLPEVAAYNIVPTATGFDHCELGGRNGAGFCSVLPDCSPTTCNWPSAATAYPTSIRAVPPPLTTFGAPGIPSPRAGAPGPGPPPWRAGPAGAPRGGPPPRGSTGMP